MVQLICQRVNENEKIKDFPEFVRKTKSICIYADDRPNLRSKTLARITVKSAFMTNSDVFCIEARGSKSGVLKADPSDLRRLGLKEGEKAEIDITEASAEDCEVWLKSNEDPERKAFGLMLGATLQALDQARLASEKAAGASEQAKQAALKSEDASKLAGEAAMKATANLDQAKKSEENAKIDREKGVIYAIAAFVAGSLFDIGMIQEKFGLNIPRWFIVVAAVLALFLFWQAPRIVDIFRRFRKTKQKN